jgi:hypothetical protein
LLTFKFERPCQNDMGCFTGAANPHAQLLHEPVNLSKVLV